MKELAKLSVWFFFIQGIIALAFGIAILAWPTLTLKIFIVLFAISAIINGLFNIGIGFSFRKVNSLWWLYVGSGIVAILIGIFTFFYPEITTVTIVLIFGIWLILSGVTRIIFTYVNRSEIDSKLAPIFVGMIEFFFGLFILANPRDGLFTLIDILGIALIIIGLGLFFVAFQFNRFQTDVINELEESEKIEMKEIKEEPKKKKKKSKKKSK